MKHFFLRLWKIVKNKYVASTLIFLLIYLFLGENNVRVIGKLRGELNDLNREAQIIEEDIRQDSLEAANLFGNIEALEAYGREHYYMKRENEDIFIVKDDKK